MAPTARLTLACSPAHPPPLPRRPFAALLAVTALLACAGSSAALTTAQLETLVQQQAATIAQLTTKLSSLQSTVDGLAPLGAIKDKLAAVRKRGGLGGTLGRGARSQAQPDASASAPLAACPPAADCTAHIPGQLVAAVTAA